jgi:hypothetical protein
LISPGIRRILAETRQGEGNMKRSVIVSIALLLAGCLGSAPGKALHEAASALERKDAGAFLAKMDTARYAAAYVDNLAQSNPALKALDGVAGKLFGMGLGEMVNSITSVEEQLVADFRKRVSSGELVNQCSQAASGDCLWVPAALRSARIRELDAKSAVAQVTVPGNIAGWIALAEAGGEWKIVGLSPSEDLAVQYAKAPPAPPAGKKEATRL